MKTRSIMTLALALIVAMSHAAFAQGTIVAKKTGAHQKDWTLVRVAKWTLLGGAVGLGAYALQNSRAAEHSYAMLRERCGATPDSCRIENGRYSDATTESLFQQSTSSDRRAQVGIYGGQVAALGSVALFIYDLRNGRGPSDIPYPSRRSVVIGGRVRF